MKTRNHPVSRQIELLLTCPRCDAGPGEWCISKSGQRARYLHDVRRPAEVSDILWKIHLDHLTDVCYLLASLADQPSPLRQEVRDSVADYQRARAWVADHPWGER